MVEENKNLDPIEIKRLREVVLDWIKPQVKPVSIVNSKPKSPPKLPVTVTNQPPSILVEARNKKPKPEKLVKPIFKKIKMPKIFFFKILFLGLIFIFISLFCFETYLINFKPKNLIVKKITQIIPFPVALVNYRFISYYDWLEQVILLNQYYEEIKKNTDQTDLPIIEESEKHILDRLIKEELIKQYASKYSIKVSNEELDAETMKMINSFGSEQDFINQIKEKYNWNLDEFKRIIFKPLLLRNKLSLYLLDHPQNQSAHLLAQDILKMLKNQNNSFENLAKKYSQDSAAINGGDVGYFDINHLNPAVAQVIAGLKPNEFSGVVKTKLGFQILRLDELLLDEQGQPAKVRLHQILIKSKDIDEFVNNFSDESIILVF